VAAVRNAERRRAGLCAELGALRQRGGTLARTTVAEYEERILEKVGQWRAVLRQEAQEARSILRELLPDRLTFTPTERDGRRIYAYSGRFTIDGLFEGVVCPQALASPTGFEPYWNPIF
jgi:hypothetical protein